MALQIWLPLDGTLENKGCTNVTVVNNGATVNTAGKIGSCYSFDGSDDYISLVCPKLNSIFSGGAQPFSVAMWINHADSSRAILMGAYGLPNTSNNSFFNLELSTAHAYRFDWRANPDWYPNNTNVGSATWSHVVCTYDGTQVKIYLNGSLTATRSGTLATLEYAGPYYLGRDSRTGTTAFNGKMNDFRVYDHCLSAAEVKELSQGLILHYKLDESYPLINKNILMDYPKIYNPTSYNAYQLNMTENLIADQTYTLQFWDIDISHTGKTTSDLGISVYWGGGAIALKTLNGTNYFTNGHADYLVCTFTITSSQASHANASNQWLNIYNSVPEVTGTKNMHIGKWKLEKGSMATDYIEYDLSNKANNPFVVTDSSGYGHHGKVVNTVSYTNDTPRYEMSLNKPSGSAINCGRGGMVTDSLTVNLWGKWSTWGNPVSCTEGGGWNFENNPVSFASYISGVGYESSSYPKASVQPTANEWHMLTGVYDRVNQKRAIYIDGKLADEKTMTVSNPISYNGSNVIWLGAEASGNATNFANANYNGKISDFRIYCTALSAEDILDLYHTSAKIDRTGKVHTFEFVENNKMNITKSGKFISPIFIESTYNFYEGGDISYKPANQKNATCPYNGIVNLSSIADLGLPISLKLEADFSWENFAFDTSATTTLLQTQGDSRLKSDNSFTWTNGINNTLRLENYVSASTSGTIHISGIKTITADKFENLNGFRFSMRCDYSDGNGTLSLSNIKATLADDKTKFTKSYTSANEFIEK